MEKESHMVTSPEFLGPARPEAKIPTLLQICDSSLLNPASVGLCHVQPMNLLSDCYMLL